MAPQNMLHYFFVYSLKYAFNEINITSVTSLIKSLQFLKVYSKYLSSTV